MAQGDVTILEDNVVGELSQIIASVELSAAYSAAFALGTAKFGLTTVRSCQCETIKLGTGTALAARYDKSDDKIYVYEGDGPTTAGPLAETDEALTSADDLICVVYGRK